jgi:hypothetical protein
MSLKKQDPVYATILLYEGKHVESLWVRKVRGRQYQLAAIPFYAYNLSLGDILRCAPDDDGIGLFIEEVLKKSGNRTVRAAFWVTEGGNHPEAIKFREFLIQSGLKWDYDCVRLFSVNIPSDEIYQKVEARLKEIPETAQLKWEDGDPQPERNMDGTLRDPPQAEGNSSG